MKITKYSITCLGLALLIAGTGVYSVVSAEESASMSDYQIQQIKDNCLSVKNTLNQLHSSDALLRVNMGQSYESMYTKLMVKLNSRLALNNIANAKLVDNSESYSDILDSFRADYIIYEEQLTKAINIDCQKQPVSFYDAVAAARARRQILHTDIVRLNQALDQYKTQFDQFYSEYKTAAQGIKSNER